MNNLKERNLLPNSVQGSSEDPPGFIYPSYRAAPTSTHSDKPSPNSSLEEVAYISSAVGGSVSTLSFEETTPKNRLRSHRRCGGGSRDRVRGFSRTSRRNLLRRLASINRSAFRAFRGRMIFVTLTYPKQYPDDPELCKNHLKALRKRIQRKFKPFAAFWRLGIQTERGVAFPPAPVRGIFCWIDRRAPALHIVFLVRGYREGLRGTPPRRYPR